jgi:uncharacterized protein (TIRG00374 family)
MSKGLKLKAPIVSLVCITLLYIISLLLIDHRRGFFGYLSEFISVVPAVLLCSLTSYLIRSARMHWLLKQSGHLIPLKAGLITYLAGFAFTATPGKLGELIRMRYYKRLGVSDELTFGAFVFERSLDLIVVFLLASIVITDKKSYIVIAIFFGIVILSIWCLIHGRHLQIWIISQLHELKLLRIEKLVTVLISGLTQSKQWLNVKCIGVGLLLGLCAWTLTSFSFVLLLNALNLDVKLIHALSIFPTSMLLGAASMLPGGIGTTELAIVSLLNSEGVELHKAGLAAVAIRAATLWFAIVLGLLSLIICETKVNLKS